MLFSDFLMLLTLALIINVCVVSARDLIAVCVLHKWILFTSTTKYSFVPYGTVCVLASYGRLRRIKMH